MEQLYWRDGVYASCKGRDTGYQFKKINKKVRTHLPHSKHIGKLGPNNSNEIEYVKLRATQFLKKCTREG